MSADDLDDALDLAREALMPVFIRLEDRAKRAEGEARRLAQDFDDLYRAQAASEDKQRIAELERQLSAQVEAVELPDSDVILLRFSRPLSMSDIMAVIERLKPRRPGALFVVTPVDSFDVVGLDEDQMRAQGWVRA